MVLQLTKWCKTIRENPVHVKVGLTVLCELLNTGHTYKTHKSFKVLRYIYAMALFWLCTIAVFHTFLVPSGLVPRYGNGSGNEIKVAKYLNPDTY